MSKEPPEIWTLQFIAVGNGPPVALRVRRLLKAALRIYGLRLIGYGDIPGNMPRHSNADKRLPCGMTDVRRPKGKTRQKRRKRKQKGIARKRNRFNCR